MEKVSVIVPCYNGEKFVDRCLESIYKQDYPMVELIVVDDGSLDSSKEKILAWENKYADRGYQLIYRYQENEGPGGAINTGLKLVTGEYLTLLDIDDRFLTESISARADFLRENLDYVGVRTNGWKIQESVKMLFATSEEEKNIEDVFEALIYGKTYNWAGTYMVRSKELFEFYKDREIYSSKFGQNLQLIMPVAYKRKFGYIDKPLMEYIVQKESLSQSKVNPYEKAKINAGGYKDIYIHMINSIVTDDQERQRYMNIIDTCFYRSAMRRAIEYDEPMELRKYYLRLKKMGKNSLDDKILFYSKKSFLIALFFRCVRKTLVLLKGYQNENIKKNDRRNKIFSK